MIDVSPDDLAAANENLKAEDFQDTERSENTSKAKIMDKSQSQVRLDKPSPLQIPEKEITD